MIGVVAPPLIRWFGMKGSRRKQPKIDIRVNVDLASLPWAAWIRKRALGSGSWFFFAGADVAVWPKSVSMLCKFTTFWGTLHWPAGAEDMEHFGISFLELLIFFEQWAGHRLLSEKVTRPHVRANAQFRFLLCLFQKESKIRQGCQFISSLVRVLGKLPGSIGRFLPCRVGSHMTRLRHLGREHCSHGLSSGKLSPSVTQSGLWGLGLSSRCSCGAFGWYAQAPLLLHGFYPLSLLLLLPPPPSPPPPPPPPSPPSSLSHWMFSRFGDGVGK